MGRFGPAAAQRGPWHHRHQHPAQPGARRLRPHWGGLALHLAAPCCLDGSWRWRVTLDGFGLVLQADDLASAASHWPAAVLSGLGTPWNTVQLQGTLAVHTQGLRVTLGANTGRCKATPQ